MLVTGHYDSRNSENENVTDAAPGANDNGSGTSVSLECARVLSKLKFPGTIIFLTVAGEEQGLYGSKHFAEFAKSQGWNVEAALNNDIVGGDKSPGQNPKVVRVFSESIPENTTEAQLRRIRGLGRGERFFLPRTGALYRSDGRDISVPYRRCSSFARTVICAAGTIFLSMRQGFPAVRFTEYRENFTRQHQNVRTENGIEYGDLPKYVDYDYVANVARLNAATLAELASAPAPPQNVRIETKELVNDSTLVWDPPADGRPRVTKCCGGQQRAGLGALAIVWEGDASDASSFEGQCDLCGQSMDEAGHKSQPIVPVPER